MGAFATAVILISIISFLGYKLNILFSKFFFELNDLDKLDNKTARYVMNEASKDDPDMIDI